MKNLSSKELIKLVEKDGWYLVNVVGSHNQFKHPTKKSKVTIPHPKKEFTKAMIKSILHQAQITLED